MPNNRIQSLTVGGVTYDIVDNTSGYLTSFTETDPIFTASVASGISSSDISNWNGKSNTDEKVKQTPLNDSQNAKALLLGNTMGASEITATAYMSNKLIWNDYLKTLSIYGSGNSNNYIKSGIWGYSTGSSTAEIHVPTSLSGNYVYTLPSSTGTIALISDIPTVPTKVSDLTNDSGFISSYTETDPTVPSWAKASSKPTYTASEVGAVATTAVGAASGVAPLNASSKIDSTYLPSYVDDVIEGYYYNNKFYTTSAHTTEITGEAGKIYVDLSTDGTYRYTGSTYAEIGSGGSVVTVSRDLTTGTKSATITVNGTGYDIYSVSDTNDKVKLTTKSDSVAYKIALAPSSITSGNTYEEYYSTNLTYNPSTKALVTGGTVDGYTLAGASAKAVDTSISAGSSSANLPTSAAVASFVEGKGYLTSFTEADPIFTASAAYGISSTDISNWNAKVSDDKTWNGVTLNKSDFDDDGDYRVPSMLSTSATTAKFLKVQQNVIARSIPRRDNNGYIYSATPSANDNSTKVATTAYVDSAVGGITVPTKVSDLTNDSGFITSYTDEKVKASLINSTTNTTYYPVVGTSTTDAETKLRSENLKFTIYSASQCWLSIGQGGSSKGKLRLYTTTSGGYTDLQSDATTGKTITLPDATGTVALTSDIPDVSGFITSDSDENVKSTAVTGATTNWIVGSTTSTTTTGGLSKHASARIYTSEDTGTYGFTQLRLGNETAVSSAGGKEGQIRLYGTNATYYLDLKAGAITDGNKIITFPNKTGTIALASEIPTVTLNGNATASPSFYAPTGAGISGQYLKSNGSGEPSWTDFPTIPSVYNSSTNPNGYLTMSTLPVYDGTVALANAAVAG